MTVINMLKVSINNKNKLGRKFHNRSLSYVIHFQHYTTIILVHEMVVSSYMKMKEIDHFY